MNDTCVDGFDRTDESNDGSDLEYAPPQFTNDSGQRIIFVDFIEAHYELLFDADADAQKAIANSTICFFADSEGFPAIDLRQPFTSVQLDGKKIDLQDQKSCDGAASFKILTKSVSPGRHELKITNTFENDGPPKGPSRRPVKPVKWYSDQKAVRCCFRMSDVKRDGGFLEAYLPSNFEYDHFRMTFSVKVINSKADHSVFTNGTRCKTGKNEWKITFPCFFTTSCPWFHLAPADRYVKLHSEHASSDGRSLPILLYTTPKRIQRGVSLEEFRDLTETVLCELESDFGPFPHDSLTIYALGIGKGGMEYAGATVTQLRSLRHELNHNYFARSITPANGDAGWIDEAIAKWSDLAYPRICNPPRRTSNMGKRSPYKRTTSRDAYRTGRDFLGYLDYVLRYQGGLKPMLADYVTRKKHTTVTAKEFQCLVEAFHGESLDLLFKTYVYADNPTPPEFPVASHKLDNSHQH